MKINNKLDGPARLFSKDRVAFKEILNIAEAQTAPTTDWFNIRKWESTEVMAPSYENPNQREINGNEFAFPANDFFETDPSLLGSPSDLHSWVENSRVDSFKETLCMVTNNENDIWLKKNRLMALTQLGHNSFKECSSSSDGNIWNANNHLTSMQRLGFNSPDQYSSTTSLAPSCNSDSSGKMSTDTVYDPSVYGADTFLPMSHINYLSSGCNSWKGSPVHHEKYPCEQHERTLVQHQEERNSECAQGKNSSKNPKNFQEKSVFPSEENLEGITNRRNEFVCKNTNQPGFEKSQFLPVQVKNLKSESTSLDCCKTFHDKPLAKNTKVAKLPSYDVASLMDLESATGFFDSHCHIDRLLNREKFYGTYTDYMAHHKDSFPKSYKGCIAVFCDPHTFAKKYLWQKHLDQDNVFGAFGCHPKSAKFFDEKIEKSLEAALNHPKVKALGEIGLDYSNGNKSSKSQQQRVFKRQLQIAQKRNLRVIIHCRDADNDAIRIMHEVLPRDTIFHLHCFTGNWEKAQTWIKEFPNCFIGITNLVTFPSAWETHEVARKLDLERLLLETDAPYFVPTIVSKGARSTHPGMAIHVAAQIAALKNINVETVLNWTCANTKLFYNIP